MARYRITGNTYEHRAALRRAGATFDQDTKAWTLEVVEHGFRRNDGLVYQLRKLPGLRVERAT